MCIRWGSNPRLRRDWGLNPTPSWFIIDERPTRPRIQVALEFALGCNRTVGEAIQPREPFEGPSQRKDAAAVPRGRWRRRSAPAWRPALSASLQGRRARLRLRPSPRGRSGPSWCPSGTIRGTTAASAVRLQALFASCNRLRRCSPHEKKDAKRPPSSPAAIAGGPQRQLKSIHDRRSAAAAPPPLASRKARR